MSTTHLDAEAKSENPSLFAAAAGEAELVAKAPKSTTISTDISMQGWQASIPSAGAAAAGGAAAEEEALRGLKSAAKKSCPPDEEGTSSPRRSIKPPASAQHFEIEGVCVLLTLLLLRLA